MPKPETVPWIKSAKEDEDVYNILKQGTHLESATYHAQQSAEKYVKAAIVESGALPRKSHDIELLMSEHSAFVHHHSFVDAAKRLTSYATLYRYPMPGANTNGPTSQEMGQIEIDLALVKAWALAQIP